MSALFARRPSGYLATADAARLVGCTPRSMSRLCASTIAGRPTPGWSLGVVRVKGRGGKSGATYAIRAGSLPRGIANDSQTAPETSPTIGDLRVAVANQPRRREALQRKLDILAPILRGPLEGPVYRRAVASVAFATGLTPQTLRKHVATVRTVGITGLLRKPASAKRVEVSRAFDKAWHDAGGDATTLATIAQALEADLASMWASEIGDAGAGMVERLGRYTLFGLARHHGHPVALEACRIAARHVRTTAAMRQIHVRATDAEAHRNALPRIARSYADCQPMEHVCLDVRYAPQPIASEGKIVYPMQVAFYDIATARLRQTLFKRDAHGVASGAHVFAAFVDMIKDPEWGFPANLSYDHGSENKWIKTLAAALASHPAASFRAIRVAPHSPQSKPIEGAFSVFAKLCMNCMPSFPGFRTGPVRKTMLGQKVAAPYPGSWEDFVAELNGYASMFNAECFGRGRSRQGRYEDAVEKGFTPRAGGDLDFEALGSQFGLRMPVGARLQIGGKHYTSDPLCRDNPQARVAVVTDPAGHRAPLLVGPDHAEPLRADPPFPQKTPEQRSKARGEADRRKRMHEDGLDARAAALPECKSVRDRIAMAMDEGIYVPPPSGVVDGEARKPRWQPLSTGDRLNGLATLRNRRGDRVGKA